jgi:hypothetical protein
MMCSSYSTSPAVAGLVMGRGRRRWLAHQRAPRRRRTALFQCRSRRRRGAPRRPTHPKPPVGLVLLTQWTRTRRSPRNLPWRRGSRDEGNDAGSPRARRRRTSHVAAAAQAADPDARRRKVFTTFDVRVPQPHCVPPYWSSTPASNAPGLIQRGRPCHHALAPTVRLGRDLRSTGRIAGAPRGDLPCHSPRPRAPRPPPHAPPLWAPAPRPSPGRPPRCAPTAA